MYVYVHFLLRQGFGGQAVAVLENYHFRYALANLMALSTVGRENLLRLVYVTVTRFSPHAPVAELVDATDSKSVFLRKVGVRFSPGAPPQSLLSKFWFKPPTLVGNNGL